MLTLLAVVSVVLSQQAGAVEPQAIDLGGVGLIPLLNVSESYDDNIRTASGIKGDPIQSSWVTSVEPELILVAIDRLNVYQLDYQLKHRKYHSSPVDDKTEHFLSASSHMEFTVRHRLDLRAQHSLQQESSDSTNRDPLNNEVGNKYRHSELGGLYSFGAKAAKVQLDIGINKEWLRYLNNRYSASQTHKQDRDVSTLITRANYNYSPKTKLIAELQRGDYSYLSNELDNNVWRYLIGASWQATPRISTEIKAGFEDKKFTKSNIKDQNNKLWEANVSWAPRTYSSFTVSAGSRTEEGSATEAFINTEQYSVNWNHDWTPRITSRLQYELTKKDYGDLGGNVIKNSNQSRQDNMDTYLVGVKYKMRPWLDLELGYSHQDNGSTIDVDSYSRNQMFFNIGMSL